MSSTKLQENKQSLVEEYEKRRIRGMTGKAALKAVKGQVELKEAFRQDFLAQGMTAEEAEKRAEIAAQGRSGSAI